MMDTDKIKAQLEDRLGALRARVGQLEADLRAPHDPDFAERATETEGDEVREGLEDSALKEMREILAALKRIDEGTYGDCVACGEPIGEARLKAVPYATLCIACAGASRPQPGS